MFYIIPNLILMFCIIKVMKKVRIWFIIGENLLKSNSYVLYYPKYNSYVLYYKSDEKKRIWFIIGETLLKSNSYMFYIIQNLILMFCIIKVMKKVRIWFIIGENLLKSMSYVLYYPESNSYVLYYKSDEKSEDLIHHWWKFV